MRFKDVVTGNTLTSDNSIKINEWRNNPERYIQIKAETKTETKTGQKIAQKAEIKTETKIEIPYTPIQEVSQDAESKRNKRERNTNEVSGTPE